MRIGMITQWYEPETGSAAHPTAIARALQARGHEVKVLTGFPSYPHGKVYDGYRLRLRTARGPRRHRAAPRARLCPATTARRSAAAPA